MRNEKENNRSYSGRSSSIRKQRRNFAKDFIRHQSPPIAAPALWEELTALRKDAVIAWIHSSATEKFYLLYTYYFKEESHRVFLADRENVVQFIREQFDEEWGEGIDIMIADTDFETVVMGNHDGMLVTRKEVFPHCI